MATLDVRVRTWLTSLRETLHESLERHGKSVEWHTHHLQISDDSQAPAVTAFLIGDTNEVPEVVRHYGDTIYRDFTDPYVKFRATSAATHPLGIWLGDEPDIDLRRLLLIADELGVDKTKQQDYATESRHWRFSNHNLWPWFAENLTAIEAELERIDGGTRPRMRVVGGGGAPTGVYRVLSAFPVLPRRIVPMLMENVFTAPSRESGFARTLLNRQGYGAVTARHALTAPDQKHRLIAAQWLARVGGAADIDALVSAARAERSAPVRSAMILALRRAGGDISAALSRETLAAEAAHGLKKGVPSKLEWFRFDELPSAAWGDGSATQNTIIHWWVVQAVALKEPGALSFAAELPSLLSADSAAALGSVVLRQWVQRDLSGTSAIDAKGMLALASWAPGREIAETVHAFMAEHYARKAQVEALLDMAAASASDEAAELVLATARRYRQPTVQTRAAQLAEAIADRRGWTKQQLADRTVSSAGLDDDGGLHLMLGAERVVTGRISPKLVLEAVAPDGSVSSSLPAQRSGNDDETYAHAKATFTAAKTDLKRVVAAQSTRLYEHMAASREWTGAEFVQHVLRHPVLGELASRLAWIVTTPGGEVIVRPDRAVVHNAAGDVVSVADNAVVRIAHVSLVAQQDGVLWRGIMAAQQDRPALFEQFDAAAITPSSDGTSVRDRDGYVTTVGVVRAVARKRGYQRETPDEGPWFFRFTKLFTELGIEVHITISGALIPEQNDDAVSIFELTFVRVDDVSRVPMTIAEVPPVLLRETYRDYLAFAAKGAFDPEWTSAIKTQP